MCHENNLYNSDFQSNWKEIEELLHWKYVCGAAFITLFIKINNCGTDAVLYLFFGVVCSWGFIYFSFSRLPCNSLIP